MLLCRILDSDWSVAAFSGQKYSVKLKQPILVHTSASFTVYLATDSFFSHKRIISTHINISCPFICLKSNSKKSTADYCKHNNKTLQGDARHNTLLAIILE